MSRRRRISAAAAVLAASALLISACGRSISASTAPGSVSPTKGLVATTAAGAQSVPSVTWAVYRDVNSLDPIYAFDYPENTVVPLLCDSLLRQAPDGSIGPGLATVTNPSPTEIVFTLRPARRSGTAPRSPLPTPSSASSGR